MLKIPSYMDKYNKILNALILVFIFTLGALLSNLFINNTYIPFSNNAEEVSSPGNWIAENNIHVYKDKILINIEETRLTKFADTNSMDPVIDKGANAIEITPKNPDDIQIGDIISFEINDGDIYVHRVIKKGYDKDGVYFITKGDNNNSADPYKIRFYQIVGILIGILY